MSKEQKRQAFYTQDQDLVLQEMETSKEGLTSSEAAKRLSEYGRNELDEGEKKSLLVKFIEQFKDLMTVSYTHLDVYKRQPQTKSAKHI